MNLNHESILNNNSNNNNIIKNVGNISKAALLLEQRFVDLSKFKEKFPGNNKIYSLN